jgi:hypothetical protein
MTIDVDDKGRINVFAKEPQMYITEEKQMGFTEKNEKLNGRLAMIGIVAALGAYAMTGQILPGIF